MQFTIKETQVGSDKSICSRCTNGLVYKDSRWNTKHFCSILQHYLKETVTHCTDFEDRRALSLYDMKQIAWIVKTDPGRVVGFSPPKDYERQKPFAVLIEDGDLEPSE
jgi:hypothetical protein